MPFCWTRHYNKGLNYVGHAIDFDTVHIDGDVKGEKFIAYYIKNNRVLACSGMGKSGDVLTVMEALEQNAMPSASEIISGAETPESLRSKMAKRTGQGKCRRESCCKKKAASA